MSSRIGTLGLLALLQLVIIGFVWFGGTSHGSGTPFLDLDLAQLRGMEIRANASEASSIVLSKSNEQWFVNDHPADENKVESVLDKLATAATQATAGRLWPVATTEQSAARFEVASDNFQREIKLLDADDETVVLYSGTSPSFERVHVRRADASAVFAIKLANFELATGVDEWLDKTLLSLAEVPSEMRLTLADSETENHTDETLRVLRRDADAWLINDRPADPSAAQTYAERFVNLRVLGLAEEDADLIDVATLEVGADDERRSFRIRKASLEDGDYIFSQEGLVGSFRVAAYVAEQLLMADAEFEVAIEVPEVPDE